MSRLIADAPAASIKEINQQVSATTHSSISVGRACQGAVTGLIQLRSRRPAASSATLTGCHRARPAIRRAGLAAVTGTRPIRPLLLGSPGLSEAPFDRGQ